MLILERHGIYVNKIKTDKPGYLVYEDEWVGEPQCPADMGANAQQKFSTFVAFNGGDELGKFLLWETYAETLQKAGVIPT